MTKPKKDSGFSIDALNEWLMRNLVGQESRDLVKQAKGVQAPMSQTGNMVNQFGSLGINPKAQQLLAQTGLLGEAAAKSNIADWVGIKDAYKYLQTGNPANAAWAALSVLPMGAGGLGKKTKNAAQSGGAKAFNNSVALLRLLFGG